MKAISPSWPTSGPGVSKPIAMKVGKRYYFEFLHSQKTGVGFAQVGWNGPQFLAERPIPSKRLIAYEPGSQKWDTTRLENRMVRYSLMEAGPLIYSIRTESVLGGAGDTASRAALTQMLNLRGANMAPPESLWQRVIFYDFHSDGSNPDFDRGPDFWAGGVFTGMVQTKGLKQVTENADYLGLDTIGKPLPGPSPRFSCGVGNWFTGWTPGWNRTY